MPLRGIYVVSIVLGVIYVMHLHEIGNVVRVCGFRSVIVALENHCGVSRALTQGVQVELTSDCEEKAGSV